MNQKNWQKKDFVDGYAEMGLEPYIKLKRFMEVNKDFSFDRCIFLVNNNNNDSRLNRVKTNAIENGTFVGKDFDYAYELAEKIRRVGKYYDSYNNRNFVIVMIQVLRNDKFDFDVFLHKLQYNYELLDKCAKAHHWKDAIEKIYNYKNQNKISLFI